MADSYGKAFENKFKEDWNLMKNACATRLKDVTMGYKKIANECDFICYKYPIIHYLECKSVSNGNTFNFKKLTQYEDLCALADRNIKGANIGVIIWFVAHKKVVFVSIKEWKRIKDELGLKSINVKMIGDPTYDIIDIPGKVKRVFIDTDYSILTEIAKNKLKEEVIE